MLSVEMFYKLKRPHGSRWYSAYCKSCNKKRLAIHRQINYKSELVRLRVSHYNISKQGFEELLINQGRKCAICEIDISNIEAQIDHDHDTGKVRGLLCRKCNQTLGFLERTYMITNNWQQKALDYLNSYK